MIELRCIHEHQVVSRGGINNITRHFRLQIPDLTFEFDLPHRVSIIGINAINGSPCSAQSMGGNFYVLHDLAGIMLNADPEST